MHRKFSILWLWLLLLPACAPPAQPTVSGEQTAQEHLTPDRLEAPALERRLHLATLGVNSWHQKNLRGKGVKVAILDSGFRGYRQFLGKGLPDQVTVRSFRKDEKLEARDSQHGILCGEVVHAVAPEAEIMLINWEADSPQAFLDAVRWAREQGAKVLSCSLIMPSWSDGEGGGEVHRALAPLLEDTLFFASAGNTAQRHWCGLFAPNDAGWHRWCDDVADNTLTPWGKERVAVELYGPTHSAFELSVCDRATGDVIGRSVLQVDGTRRAGRAVVRFEPDENARYLVKVRCVSSPTTRMEAFHLVALGASLECTTCRGSIPFPGDGARVLAVGAVDARGERLSYSSCGPNSRLPKPDFVATVPFPSLCRERPFAGTSAAAPQAAGLAAVWWSSRPSWTAAELTQAMRGAALDLGPPGHDHETGYGLIRLPR
jgi:subtilisin family serine protease